MTSKKGVVYLFAIAAMFFWAFSFIWTKDVYNYITPYSLVLLRLSISSALLFLIIKIIKKQEKVEKKDLKWFLLLAFVEPYCYFLGESNGMTMVSPTIASVIIASIPIFSPFMAYFFYKERISMFNFLGILISFFGLLMIIVNKDFNLDVSVLGILLMFVAVLASLVYVVIIKKLASKYNTFTIIKYQNLIGAIYFIPMVLFFEFDEFINLKPTFELIKLILLLAVLASTFAFLFYIKVIREIGISRANIFTNFIPLITALFSFIVLDEKLDSLKLLGILVFILGIFMSQMRVSSKYLSLIISPLRKK